MLLGRVPVEVGAGLENLRHYDLVAHKVALRISHAHGRVDRVALWKSGESRQCIVSQEGMCLVDSSVDNAYFDAGSCVALASHRVPKGGCANESRRSVHVYSVEIVWYDPAGSGSVQQVVHVMTVEVYGERVERD